jgi:signal transduction histidine kinase
MNDDDRYVRTIPHTGFLRSVLVAPVWALPFALFFGSVYGARWPYYRLAYLEALVFTLTIRVALWATARWGVAALRIPRGEGAWIPVTLAHVTGALLGSYAGAFVVQALLAHDFVGGPRGVLIVGLWSLLFSALFTGIILARRFHEEAVQHAAQVERVRAELVRAELRALQAQVNPHFLFNTLNSIASLIGENPPAAEDLTTRLADVFRYALTASRREHVRLGEELEFVRTWLSIEHVRFGDLLRVTERIEAGVEDIPVPALLLQPLVENAVRYAVGAREGGGEVRIEAARSGDALRLVVADDGPGFEPGSPPRGTGVGLESVRERLRLAGAGHALELDTAPGRGTRVTLTLPANPVPAAATAAVAGPNANGECRP